ncbi:glycosyltransferase family 4 protein [Quadrisphaera sp. DSM 44207]|uniref:glycosyltransferase family 4 protein n=1 Tax=Quadrisphaera sp. DSM 44207 TaxID=1881057 RepID=UPI0008874188|nr:glycosyltransferase family 4 protein [Quadrisphaera sp. DSM 44207]SDQ84001.1 Glycosyltransferase Family 4 [Quadrisphaera sp. DSM 44207]
MQTPSRPVALLSGPAAFGGAQRYLLSLLRHLPAALVALPPVDAQLAAGAEATGRPRRTAQGPAPQQVADAVAATGARAVHVNCTDPVAEVPLLRAALATGLPVTATVHMTDRYARTPAAADLPAVYAALGGVVAPSRPIAEHLVREHGVPAARVHHVPNGVAPPPPVALRERPAGSPLRVGCLARLTRQKGLDVLLDAVRALPAGTVEVVVAGEGREAAALAAAARDLPVVFRGFAADVHGFLADLDAYVQPSREDALPLALLEAAGAGLPCAATRVGDVPEHLDGAVLLVEPGDAAALAAALARLAADAGLRARLARCGRERVLASHTDAAMAACTAAVLAPAWGS